LRLSESKLSFNPNRVDKPSRPRLLRFNEVLHLAGLRTPFVKFLHRYLVVEIGSHEGGEILFDVREDAIAFSKPNFIDVIRTSVLNRADLLDQWKRKYLFACDPAKIDAVNDRDSEA
jgi:hypothetical protein